MTRHAPAIAFTATCALAALILGTWVFVTTTSGGPSAISAQPSRYVFALLVTFTALLVAGAIPFALLRRWAGPQPSTTKAALAGAGLCDATLLILSLANGLFPSAYEFGLTTLAGAGLGAFYLLVERAIRSEAE